MTSRLIDAARRRRETMEKSLAVLQLRQAEVDLALDEATVALQIASATVNTLTAERADILAQSEHLRAAMHDLPTTFDPTLLRRVPVELLAAIFEEAALGPDPFWVIPGDGVWFNRGRSMMPFSFASVCSHWRRIALATPAIWTYVALPPLTERHKVLLYPYKLHLERLLKRSKSRPIDIFLHWDDLTHRWADLPLFHEIIATISLHANRWLKVYLEIPEGVDLQGVEFLRSPTPLLEDFILVSAGRTTVLPSGDLPNYLPHCPRLRRLYASTIFPYPQTPLTSLTYATLTVSDQQPAALWHTLGMMPALVELSIYFEEDDSDFPLPAPPPAPPTTQLSLPSLRKFRVRGDPTTANAWADTLQFPVVEELVIPADYIEDLQQLIPAVFAGITRLTLAREAMNIYSDGLPAEDMDVLAPLGALRQLTLENLVVEDAAVARLSTDTALWPQLNYVALAGVRLTARGAERFVEFARIRATGAPGAFTVKINPETEPTWLKAQLAILEHLCLINDTAGDNDRSISDDSDEEDEAKFTDSDSDSDSDSHADSEADGAGEETFPIADDDDYSESMLDDVAIPM